MRTRFDNSGNPDIKAVMNQYRDAVKRRIRWVGPLLGLIVIIVVVLTGLYSIGPGEVGVVRTFGKNTGQTGPGLHFAFPLFQQVDKVNIEKVHQLEVGFRSESTSDRKGNESTSNKRVDNEALMLTGDENIVQAQLIVQYVIADPAKVLFRLRDYEKTLHAAIEVALRGVVGRTTIDEVLTRGREQAQIETKKDLQDLLDVYDSGIRITEVKLQEVDAPDEVQDAFHDVVRAREEREKVINEAKGYQADIIPKARGEAQKRLRAAEAYKEQRTIHARGDVARFVSVFAEYAKAKTITRERLYFESLQRIMQAVSKKVLIDAGVAKNSLPVLNLGALLAQPGAAQ